MQSESYHITIEPFIASFQIHTTFATSEILRDKLLSVEGVQHVFCDKFKITVFIAPFFGLEEVKTNVVQMLEKYLNPKIPPRENDL